MPPLGLPSRIFIIGRCISRSCVNMKKMNESFVMGVVGGSKAKYVRAGVSPINN